MSISNRYGKLLSAVATGLNMPLQAIVRPTHGDEIGQPLLQLQFLICMHSYGSDVGNEAALKFDILWAMNYSYNQRTLRIADALKSSYEEI